MDPARLLKQLMGGRDECAIEKLHPAGQLGFNQYHMINDHDEFEL